MSRESSPDQPASTRLDDDTFIYRAASGGRRWLTADKQKATDEAFHRRPPDHPRRPDLDGLSFGRTPEEAVRGLDNPVPGIIRVRVGDLRRLRIEIDPDTELNVVEDKPGHALIDNLPFYYDDISDPEKAVELKKAIRWAELIAEISEVRPEDQLPKSYWRERDKEKG